MKTEQIIELVRQLTNNFTNIIPRNTLKEYPKLNWGNNGVGNRWANKIFNYTVIYKNGKTKTYSDNENYTIENDIIINFLSTNQNINELNGIIGIFPHSVKTNTNNSRQIKQEIQKIITNNRCVNCGTTNDIVCDHKNDLYNDKSVLNVKTQTIEDFQPLCNHCNLQKRQIAKEEYDNKKLFSAKCLPQFQIYEYEFPWEKKTYDIKNPYTKKDTYWYDPVEFMRKIRLYDKYVIPIIWEIKQIAPKYQ